MPKGNVPFEVAIRKEPDNKMFFDLWINEDDVILGDVPITEEQYQKLKDIGVMEV